MYILFTFHSTHFAIYAEKVLINGGIDVKIIPVPRSISSSCGLAARIAKTDYKKAQEIIKQEEIETDQSYVMDDKGNVKELS